MGVPSRRALLRWFHELEDDSRRSGALRGGWDLIQAARIDLIDAQDVDGFAALVLEIAREDLIDFDHPAGQVEEFGIERPMHALQEVRDLRSTAKGRGWLRESPPPSTSFTFERSTVGQVAGGNITNYVSFAQVLRAAEEHLDQIDADPVEREAARGLLDALRGHVAQVATGTGAGLAAQVIAAALGLSH